MSARYYQGVSVLGPVRESAARTFREVVEALKICPKLPINRQAFLALDKKQRNEMKQVPFFVPATFKESPSVRKYEHAVHCNLIFLDIDELPDGRCPAAPFVRNPALLEQQLEGFNFAAHTTASSTPQKPRMRIIVDADQIPLSEYPRAVATIGALLGLPTITKESSVAVQPMFLPTLFADTPDDEHPLLTSRTDARAFRHEDITDSLDSYNGANGKNGKNGKHSSHNQGTASVDALEYLRAPVPEISLGIAEEVLSSLDADCARDEWIAAASALRHQFAPHKDDEAYELFDAWSRKGDKYGGADETEAIWKSVRPTPIGRVPVTIRTLLKRAVESGWNDQRVRENCFSATLRWMEEVPTIMEMMEHGPKKILATPLLTSMQEDLLVGHLSTQAKRRFAHNISPTAIRKDVARLKAEARSHEEAPEKKKEPPWAKDVCYVAAADDFYRHRTGEKMKTPAFNASYGRFLLPSKAELNAKGINADRHSLSTPEISPSVYALNNLQIPTVYDYAYDPSKPTEIFFIANGSRLVNVYSPTYPQPDPRHAAEAGRLLTRHLDHLIAEPEYRRTVIDFMAYQVQVPGRKIRWAILLQSSEGAGKTWLAEVMKAVLGTEHVRIIDGNSIKSGWNEWSFGSQIVVVEEVKVSGVNKYEVMNSLKHLITNEDIPVNERFRNTRQVKNITNYLMFSNHHDALALTPGDRRYFVVKSPLQTKQQVLDLGEDYFPPMYAILRDHPGGMRSFLADWEISPDFRADGHAPRTKYVTEMVNDSASDLHGTIRRLLLEGDFPLVQYDIVSAGKLKDVLVHEEGLGKTTAQHVSQILREEGMIQVGRHLIGTERAYLWARPGITEEQAVAIAADRVKRDLKNLHMELIF